jgi:hypothetical protein
LVKNLIRILPGVILCIVVTFVAVLVQMLEVLVVGQPYLKALVIPIVLGVAIRSAWTPGPYWSSGIHTKPETQMIQVVQLERGLQAESRIDLDRLEAPRELPSSVDKGSCPLGVHDAKSALRRQWRLRIWSLLRAALPVVQFLPISKLLGHNTEDPIRSCFL